MDPLAANRRRWDEVVAHHLNSEFYGVDRFREGADNLKPPELELLGDVQGKRLLHLQCHFGMDTLALARRGAHVTGVDLAPKAIEAARALAEELAPEFEQPPRFEAADVLSLAPAAGESTEASPPDLGVGTYDIVFASFGVMGWIRDPSLWMRIAHHHLRPGGKVVLVDFHPVPQALSFDKERPGHLTCQWPYDGQGRPDPEDDPSTYAEPTARIENTRVYWWAHPMTAVLQAAVSSGLQLKTLREWTRTWWNVFPGLQPAAIPEGEPAAWQLPSPESLPLTYGFVAVRPAL